MWQRLFPEAVPSGPRADAHWRAAVHVHCLQQGSHNKAFSSGAHEPTYRAKGFHMRSVWEVLQPKETAEEPLPSAHRPFIGGM
ncbi:hypothetical protein LUU34_01617600 [Aix galericulata]|nr:hypothetical protein LUU34_01617600 [Aix galericulata]